MDGLHTLEIPTPFPIGPVNCFLLRGERVVLFDCGPRTDEAWDALVAALKEHGLAPGDVDTVVITHGHLDHVGNLKRFLDASGADAYAHPLAAARLKRHEEDRAEARQWVYDIMIELGAPEEISQAVADRRDNIRGFSEVVDIPHTIHDDTTVLGFRALHVPGHSPSDTLFVNEEAGEAIGGDHVLTVTNPNPLIRRPEPGQEREKSLVEYQASLRRTRALGLKRLWPGHGGVLEDPAAAIDAILSRHERRCRRLLAALNEHGPASPFDLVQRLHPRLDVYYTDLGLSSVLGHLEVLEAQGEAVLTHDDGIMTAAAAG